MSDNFFIRKISSRVDTISSMRLNKNLTVTSQQLTFINYKNACIKQKEEIEEQDIDSHIVDEDTINTRPRPRLSFIPVPVKP